MKNKLLSLYGLKFNPFINSLPVASLWVSPQIDSFCFCIEQQIRDGGFSLICAEPGLGKSAALRILQERLKTLPDVHVGVLSRPHCSGADFYRELGDIFSVTLSPHNRWAGTKVLREKWKHHIETSLCRPVLLIDEAQECFPNVLNELRLLSSTQLDSCNVLSVVLCADKRIEAKLQSAELVPLFSRIRNRLHLQPLHADTLLQCLEHLLEQAGNHALMSANLKRQLCEHALGNLRTLANMANELLTQAIRLDKDQIDEALFFEVFAPKAHKHVNKGALKKSNH